MTARCAGRSLLLDDVSSIVEIDGTGFNAAVDADGIGPAVGRNEGAVVAQPEINRQLRIDLPGVLEVEAHLPAQPRSLMHVAASRAVRHVEQERRDGVARIDVGRRRIGRLLQRVAGIRVGVERFKSTAAEFAAETERVIADDLRDVGLPLVNIGFVRIQRVADTGNTACIPRCRWPAAG